MKALVKTKTGIGNIEVREIEKPRISPNEVLIRVHAAGICGSDLHIYNWSTQVTMNVPVAMGHEFSGVVEEVGDEVTGWKPGDRVTAEPSYSVCGKCAYCMAGRYNLCNQRKVLGFYTDGAFAEYVAVPAYRVHRLPDSINFNEGALTEPLACCVHGIRELADIGLGEFVVLTGPGAMGLLSLQVAKSAGAVVAVIGTEKDRDRLKLAEQLGADYTYVLEEEKFREEIPSLTDSLGADSAVECSGAGPAVNTCFSLLKKSGKYLQLGLFGKPITIDFESIAYREFQVYGSFAQKWSAWKLSLGLMERGEVDLKSVISHEYTLDQWETAFQKMNDKEGLKIILKP